MALAAPAGGKPPDNPFEERGGADAGGQDEGEAPGKKASESSKAGARDEAPASDAEEPPAEEAAGEDEEAESGLHALACLEGDSADGKRKGVQRRDFLKKHRFELGAVGGWYASDALSSTYSYGGALAFYPSEEDRKSVV